MSAEFIDQFKRALRDDRSLAPRYGHRQAANVKLLLSMLMLRYPNIHPSGPTIMADCCWKDERTLTQAKKLAIEAGWLVQAHKGTGPGDSSSYGLRIPELPASNAGTSNAGTSNAGTSNAAELPASNAENYLHLTQVKDPSKDPNKDSKAGVDDLHVFYFWEFIRESGWRFTGETCLAAGRPAKRPRRGSVDTQWLTQDEHDRDLAASSPGSREDHAADVVNAWLAGNAAPGAERRPSRKSA